MAYLYTLASGHVVRSFAHAAARSAGLDEKIVKRALEVKILPFEHSTFQFLILTFACYNYMGKVAP